MNYKSITKKFEGQGQAIIYLLTKINLKKRVMKKLLKKDLYESMIGIYTSLRDELSSLSEDEPIRDKLINSYFKIIFHFFHKDDKDDKIKETSYKHLVKICSHINTFLLTMNILTSRFVNSLIASNYSEPGILNSEITKLKELSKNHIGPTTYINCKIAECYSNVLEEYLTEPDFVSFTGKRRVKNFENESMSLYFQMFYDIFEYMRRDSVITDKECLILQITYVILDGIVQETNESILKIDSSIKDKVLKHISSINKN
jgi:hypothetical protein